MEYTRVLNLQSLLEKKSFFLFGPRSTGKTYLIHTQLHNDALIIDLNNSDYLIPLSARPAELEDIITEQSKQNSLIVIDEIQRVPLLLNEVHRLIESKKYRFLLTGSSARKLKRGQANMLAGRAWTAHLFSLTYSEIKHFKLQQYLKVGGLPMVYDSNDPDEELRAYVMTYLNEEIRAEGLIRNLPPFTRFLKTATLSNGELINYSQIASDAEVAPSTVREYYSVLEDTLIGFQVLPWTKSKKRKAIQTAKFYFFDPGVVHAISGTKSIDRNSDLFGRSFEQFVAMELRACLSYSRKFDELSFWRSVNRQEVDFIIGDHTAIEVKSSEKITKKHLKGLKALREEGIIENFYLVSQDKVEKNYDGIHCLYWENFLNMLNNEKLF